MRVAVVGGGVSGLAACHRLRQLLGPDALITVLEQTGRFGGKLRTVELAGHRVDVGAEAFLARRPEATALLGELGLGVAHPGPARSTVRAGGGTRALPRRTVLGIPGDAAEVADLLSADALRRVAAEPDLPPLHLDGDVGLGELLAGRFGSQLVDRLVDPLLGGVYAGGVHGLGLRATVPALAAALDGGATSLTEAARAVMPPVTANPAPVFGTLTTGLGGLPERLAHEAAVDVRLNTTVRALRRQESGWRLELGAAATAHAPAERTLDVDAVLLAVPAPAARKLLDGLVPAAASAYAGIEVASMAVVALALPPGTPLPGTSGVLIARGERHADGNPFAAKAFTFSATKWAHLAVPDAVLLRGSIGRHGEPGALRADDDELVRLVLADLAELTGITARPIDALVTRWGGGLPQYGVGHLDRVAAIEAAVEQVPGLAVAGAALHGVGVPACIATARAAAQRLAG